MRVDGMDLRKGEVIVVLERDEVQSLSNVLLMSGERELANSFTNISEVLRKRQFKESDK